MKRLKKSSWWSVGMVCYYAKDKISALKGEHCIISPLQVYDLNKLFHLPYSANFTGNANTVNSWLVDGMLHDANTSSLYEILSVAEHIWKNYMENQVGKGSSNYPVG